MIRETTNQTTKPVMSQEEFERRWKIEMEKWNKKLDESAKKRKK